MFGLCPWSKGPHGKRMTAFRHIGAGLICLLLVACGGDDGPPPIDYRSGTYGKSSMPSHAGTVVVRRGDTVYGLSQRYNVSTRAIIDANRLRPPFTLQVGQRLKLPAPKHHVVARGETLYGVSRRYGLDMRSLARVNGLRSPYMLQVGQRLAIPGGAAKSATRKSTPPKAKPSRKPTKTATTPSKPKTPLGKPPPRSKSGFEWPVRGRLVSGFGPKAGGLHNDGVNIASSSGSPVKAAQNGVVAYAGTAIDGYGRLILVKHADGWTSAYAHNKVMLVARGDKVKRGQVIAKVGQTGDVKSPQLHFELRKGTRAVDPIKLMGRP